MSISTATRSAIKLLAEDNPCDVRMIFMPIVTLSNPKLG